MSVLTALVVDDFLPNSSLAMMRLRGLGFESTVCGHAYAALDELRAFSRFDLVAIDLHMPDMSGADLIRELRSNPDWATLPVLLISVDPKAATIEGADHVLLKPYSREQFESAVKETLRRRGRELTPPPERA